MKFVFIIAVLATLTAATTSPQLRGTADSFAPRLLKAILTTRVTAQTKLGNHLSISPNDVQQVVDQLFMLAPVSENPLLMSVEAYQEATSILDELKHALVQRGGMPIFFVNSPGQLPPARGWWLVAASRCRVLGSNPSGSRTISP